MNLLISILAGLLAASAVYLMLNRNIVKFLFGLILFSSAANIILFGAGRMTEGKPAFIPQDAWVANTDVANALPQALILTALVISFGLLSFALVLAYRTYQEIGTVDVDEIGLARLEDLAIEKERDES